LYPIISEINFDNSQKIIIENTDVGYFNTSNLMVAFSGGENGEILLGSDCDDIIFAKDGDGTCDHFYLHQRRPR
jgi:hypothetical protein